MVRRDGGSAEITKTCEWLRPLFMCQIIILCDAVLLSKLCGFSITKEAWNVSDGKFTLPSPENGNGYEYPKTISGMWEDVWNIRQGFAKSRNRSESSPRTVRAFSNYSRRNARETCSVVRRYPRNRLPVSGGIPWIGRCFPGIFYKISRIFFWYPNREIR